MFHSLCWQCLRWDVPLSAVLQPGLPLCPYTAHHPHSHRHGNTVHLQQVCRGRKAEEVRGCMHSVYHPWQCLSLAQCATVTSNLNCFQHYTVFTCREILHFVHTALLSIVIQNVFLFLVTHLILDLHRKQNHMEKYKCESNWPCNFWDIVHQAIKNMLFLATQIS